MAVDIQVPELGESITEATVAGWQKQAGDAVREGEVLVELETDKVMVEVPAPEAGVLAEIRKPEGETVYVGDVLCTLEPGAATAQATAAAQAPPAAEAPAAQAPAPAQAPAAAPVGTDGETASLTPSARRMVEEHRLDASAIAGSGRGGQVTKTDVVEFMERGPSAAPAAPAAPATAAAQVPAPRAARASGEREERVKMTRLRQRIAERLLQAQHNAAMLTTFNEVDMSAVMALRGKYKEQFREKYGMAIGFMSFFTKACIEALKAFPAVNAEIDGDEIVYKNYFDIGVAVGTPRGLVVPIVRDADQLRFIEIELAIAELAGRARDGKLGVDDLTGGTFTISNGGVYGSMLSTPILNPPQSAILGMHNIVKRPVVIGDEIVVRPMMYLALSYDHRIIDGREAVQFLVTVKQGIEDPARMLLEI